MASGGGYDGVPGATEWACIGCTLLNEARLSFCGLCGAPRVVEDASTSHSASVRCWCRVCGGAAAEADGVCPGCALQLQAPADHPPRHAGPAPSSWRCLQCTLDNPDTCTHCEACGAAAAAASGLSGTPARAAHAIPTERVAHDALVRTPARPSTVLPAPASTINQPAPAPTPWLNAHLRAQFPNDEPQRAAELWLEEQLGTLVPPGSLQLQPPPSTRAPRSRSVFVLRSCSQRARPAAVLHLYSTTSTGSPIGAEQIEALHRDCQQLGAAAALLVYPDHPPLGRDAQQRLASNASRLRAVPASENFAEGFVGAAQALERQHGVQLLSQTHTVCVDRAANSPAAQLLAARQRRAAVYEEHERQARAEAERAERERLEAEERRRMEEEERRMEEERQRAEEERRKAEEERRRVEEERQREQARREQVLRDQERQLAERLAAQPELQRAQRQRHLEACRAAKAAFDAKQAAERQQQEEAEAAARRAKQEKKDRLLAKALENAEPQLQQRRLRLEAQRHGQAGAGTGAGAGASQPLK